MTWQVGLCAFGSSCTGTPSRRALRVVERTLTVGHEHWARRCKNFELHI